MLVCYRIFVRKLKENTILGSSWSNWEGDIKKKVKKYSESVLAE
jgi:hypothetical protein